MTRRPRATAVVAALCSLSTSPTTAAATELEEKPMDLATVTRTVRVGEHEFPVVDHGEGPAVLLLHGFPDSRHLWRHQVPALAEAGFRVLAPDLRGFGDAPKPAGVDSYALPLVIGEGPWRYERMEGVSHWLMLDRPDELNRLLIGFLSGVEDAVEGGD